MRALTLVAVSLASLLAGPAWASGDGSVLPFGLDPYGGTQAEQDAFYGQGHVGVLMGRAPWSRLFAGWRLMHGQAVGTAAGRGLARPCCDANGNDDITAAWRAARLAVPGVAKLDYITVFRPIHDFLSVQTCFADAFTTAARTLADRIAAHGAADPAVRAWLDGQDAVFAACHGDADLPALPADAPPWLVQDRAYQEAARALYERHFDAAETQFAAIAADAGSPWQKLGPYLAARAAVDAALPSQDPALTAQARERLAALGRPGALGQESAAKLGHALDFRTDPEARRAALVAELSGAALPDTAAPDFKDLRRLGQQPPGQPEFLDWLTVFGRAPDNPEASWFDRFAGEQPWKTDADARQHAQERWDATHDPAWLLALLQATDPGPNAAALATAAQSIAANSPAWLTAAYHRFRLQAGDPAAVARELDGILARTDLTVTDRNLFLAERTLVAADMASFLRTAQRMAPCATSDATKPVTPASCLGDQFGMDVYDSAPPGGMFGDDALATIDRLPMDVRTTLAESPALSAPLRLDVALTSWTRAVLLADDAAADRLARTLTALLPQAAPELARFVGTPPGPDKRFAAWFLLAKLPGAATHLMRSNVSAASDPNAADYIRPAGALNAFEGHWPDWVYAPAGAPPLPAAVPSGDLVCRGLCGGGAFPYRAPPFALAGAERADAERGRYAPASATPGVVHVWEEMLRYIQAHPADPRAAEALYRLVRVSRFGHGYARSSFRAFSLLKSRYGMTSWAKETKYFYD